MTAPDRTSEPALSVVIPHYNQPDGLARALGSLAGQGVPLETIVVDNGSATLPEAVCTAHPFVRLMSERERGPGPARTTGARAARAPLIAFLDADCEADPDWAQAILERFAAEPTTDVLGGAIRVIYTDPDRPTAIEGFEDVFAYRQKIFVERDNYTATCNMAVRAAVFAEVGGFGGLSIAEDMDWGRRAHALGKRIVYAPEMRIATPARESFAEVARKLDRQLAHDYAAARPSLKGRVIWALKTLAMPFSPFAQIGMILGAERLPDMRARVEAFGCLLRTRLWRMRRMAELMVGTDPDRLTAGWRRQGGGTP